MKGPEHGVFLPNRKSVEMRPHKIEDTRVYLDSGDLKVVEWKDDKNSIRSIDRYEVEYDEEHEQSYPVTADKCILKENSNTFLVRFGSPKVKPGNMYTVKIRAVNGSGPGEWSNPKLFRFKTGPPNKPKKPTIIVMSPTEVLIRTRRLKEKDENGSKVVSCTVEYTKDINEDSNELTWDKSKLSLKQKTTTEIELNIGSLRPDTRYRFRIKMINESGESAPSDSTSVITTQLIPGPPQGLRISSKRKDTTVKLRWEEPSKHPHAAYKYHVQMRRLKETDWTDYDTVDKKSAKVTQLSSDTRYRFRVQLINNKEEAGEYSEEIEVETRFGLFGQTIGTIGAFVGGTLGGPLIGAASRGSMAAAAAKRQPNSQTGKRVA